MNYLVLYTHYESWNFSILDFDIQSNFFTDQKPLFHCVTKKSNLSPRSYRAQMQLTKFSKLKTFKHQEKIFLLLICSVDISQKLNFNLTNLNTNNHLHKFILLFYKITLFNPYCTQSSMKKCYFIKNMILILFSLNMAMTNFNTCY